MLVRGTRSSGRLFGVGRLVVTSLAFQLALAATAAAATYTVTDASDSGANTLRDAITQANTSTGVPDTIVFDAAVTSITLTSALPDITDTLVIDGTINASYVEIAASSVPDNCFDVVSTDDCEFYGLYIHGFNQNGIHTDVNSDGVIIGAPGKGNIVSGQVFGSGIYLEGNDALVQSNIVGLAPDGTTAMGNSGGITSASGTNNVIGGDTAAERNVCAASTSGNGINVIGGSATVQGNYCGTDVTGLLDRGNTGHGIYCQADGTIIGGANAGEGNVSSGNGFRGIQIFAADNVVITGNTIGLGADGSTAVGNSEEGIFTFGDTDGLQIIKNVISSNAREGIDITGDNSTIQGNVVGLNAAGTAARGNQTGILLNSATTGHLVGGSAASERNIISSNTFEGIACNAGTVTIRGNYIGTDITGLVDLGNGTNGVQVQGNTGTIRDNVVSGNNNSGLSIIADNWEMYGNIVGLGANGTTALGNTQVGISGSLGADGVIIGSSAVADRNIISSNPLGGIQLSGPAPSIVGNYVGVDVSGTLDRGNGTAGVSVGSTGAVIRGNVISGSDTSSGIVCSSVNAQIHGNYIGTSADGETAIPNASSGISIDVAGVTIGTSAAADRNIISGNGVFGVTTSGTGTTVEGNYIGTDDDGMQDVGNTNAGISVSNTATSFVARGNVISGNNSDGVNCAAAGATIHGNTVGLAVDGATGLANSDDGIHLTSTATGSLVGTVAVADRNIISGNASLGINCAASSAVITGNYIGTDSTGALDRGNTLDGIELVSTATSTQITSNVISGNNARGIDDNGADSVIIQSNICGLNSAGTGALGNTLAGIYLRNSSDSCSVTNNTSSSNSDYGIRVDASQLTTIQGNKIGTNTAGTTGFGNTSHGISINTAAAGPSEAALIGGFGVGEGNLVMGNGAFGIEVNSTAGGRVIGNIVGGQTTNTGIQLTGAGAVTVQGNQVGLNAAGTAASPNTTGIAAGGTGGHLIGGTVAAERNIVSGNSANGIVASAANVTIRGNYIGTDPAGALDLGNTSNGISLTGNNGIVRDNVISGNNSDGVNCTGDNPTFYGNIVGLTAAGTAALGNSNDGIELTNASDLGIIGSAAVADRNYVSGNGVNGLNIVGTNVTIRNNYIGTDTAGNVDLGNTNHGIFLTNNNALVRDNLLSGNNQDGMNCTGDGPQVYGNIAGLNAAGTAMIPNGSEGMEFTSASDLAIIGTSAAADRNIMSGNTASGLNMSGTNGTIKGNYFGTDITGNLDLGNGTRGISVGGTGNNAVIGGSLAGEGNLISGNTDRGISMGGGDNVVVRGNIIGLNAAGTGGLGNSQHGIFADTLSNDLVVVGNTVARNNSTGIWISNCLRSVVQGNKVGTDINGVTGFGNNGIGINIDSAQPPGIEAALVGGFGVGEGNIVYSNTSAGIQANASNSVRIQANKVGLCAPGMNLTSTGIFTVQGNTIGLDQAGAVAAANNNGITVGGSGASLIGGTTAQERNIISFNTNSGINLGGSNATIRGNYIGVDATGALDFGNTTNGISLTGNSHTVRDNVISGNGADGINCTGDTNLIHGNTLGLTAAGTAIQTNGSDGIELTTTSDGVLIGSSAVANRNIISGNTGRGVRGAGTNTVIEGNYIGTDVTGLLDLGNTQDGVSLLTNPGIIRGNVISGNTLQGIDVESGSGTVIVGNFIGLGADGTTALGNSSDGVNPFTAALNTTIGGAALADRNIISSNGNHGINSAGDGTIIRNNIIGSDVTGLLDRGNTADGVNTTINGSLTTIRDNVISGNGNDGVDISSDTTDIHGNTIGLAADGSTVLTNGANGINLGGNSDGSIIGTSALTDRNIVSGNTTAGMALAGTNFSVTNNYVGTDVTGLLDRGNTTIGLSSTGTGATFRGNLVSGNGGDGINCTSDSVLIHGNTIGLGSDGSTIINNGGDGVEMGATSDIGAIGTLAVADRNVISANTGLGINLASTNVTVRGNYIGTDSTGSLDRGNTLDGIEVAAAVTNLVVEGNVISGNTLRGIDNNGADNADILSNIVGLNATGTAAIANGDAGVYLRAASNSNDVLNNTISSNGLYGLRVDASELTVVRGNKVGTDGSGAPGFGNTSHGISIFTTLAGPGPAATIGGAGVGEGNIVYGNGGHGIEMNTTAGGTVIGNSVGSSGAVGVRLVGAGAVAVRGNIIGLNSAGTAAAPNLVGIDALSSSTGIHTVGGTTAADRNIISGNTGAGVDSSSNGISIQGNYIGTDITGLLPVPNGGWGVDATSNSMLVRDNVIAANTTGGIFSSGDSGQVFGNLIGLGADGVTPLGNGGDGIELTSAVDLTVVGSVAPADRNVIALNSGDGIDTSATNSSFIGNSIGTNAAGTSDLPNTLHGISFSGGSGDINATVSGNIIAHNTLDNVFIATQPKGVSIGVNQIDGDCRFPISFNGALVANDALDADFGANNQQNFPTIDPVDPIDVVINGDIASEASTTYTINVFASAVAHSSGNGPGEVLVGATSATTDGSGDATWSIPTGGLADGLVLSALAMAPNGDTSHFSPSITVSDTTAPSSLASITPTLTNNTTLNVDFTAADPSSGIDSTELFVKSPVSAIFVATGLTLNGTSGTFNYTAVDGDGTYEFYTVATDNDTNTESAPVAADDIILLDTAAPTSLASIVDNTLAGDAVAGGYTEGDGTGSGVASVDLWVKAPGGVWTNAGTQGGGLFFFLPANGDGEYRFATTATDNATNSEIAPTGADPGDIVVLWNDVANSNYTYASVADGTYIFPMTTPLDMTITFSGGASGGPITVSRVTGDVSEGGYDAAKLIDESLAITGTFVGAADITWNFDSTSDDTLTGSLTTVFQFESGAMFDIFPVTPVGNSITIGPVGTFSNWYAGDNTASADDWMVLDRE